MMGRVSRACCLCQGFSGFPVPAAVLDRYVPYRALLISSAICVQVTRRRRRRK